MNTNKIRRNAIKYFPYNLLQNNFFNKLYKVIISYSSLKSSTQSFNKKDKIQIAQVKSRLKYLRLYLRQFLLNIVLYEGQKNDLK